LPEQTRHNSKDFTEVLRQLIRAMNTGGYFGADKILHFNGRLFDNDAEMWTFNAKIDGLTINPFDSGDAHSNLRNICLFTTFSGMLTS